MKSFLLLFCLAVGTLVAQTYNVEYTYNASGGRKTRKVIVIEPPESRMAETEPQEEQETMALEEQWTTGEVSIYPNPTRGALMIDFSGSIFDGDINSAARINLYDSSGRLLQTHRANGGILQLDLTSYPAGWFLLHLQNDKEQREYKIIKK